MTDEQLLQKYIDSGDDAAFAILDNRYRRLLVRKAAPRVGGHAEDVVQEVFVKVARYADKWNPDRIEARTVGWWIHQWLDKCIVDQIRKTYSDKVLTNCFYNKSIRASVRRMKTASMNPRTRELEPPDNRTPPPDKMPIEREFAEAFRECFNSLHPKDAQAVQLILIDGNPHRKAAAISGEHATQLARCLRRANASMQAALASHA